MKKEALQQKHVQCNDKHPKTIPWYVCIDMLYTQFHSLLFSQHVKFAWILAQPPTQQSSKWLGMPTPSHSGIPQIMDDSHKWKYILFIDFGTSQQKTDFWRLA